MSDILQRVRMANPIADPDDIDSAEFEMALAAIEDRWEFGDKPRRIPATLRHEWLGPALVATGAAVLAILVIAAPILFLRGEEQSVTDTTHPPVPTTTQVVTTTLPITTTAPAPTTDPPPIPVVPATAWQRVPHESVFEEAWINAVMVGGPGVVAAGGHGPYALGWPIDAAVWVSSDGVVWDSIDEPSFTGNAPDAGESWGARIADLATGSLGLAGGGHFGTVAAIWTSQDGINWSRVLDDDLLGDESSGILGITAGGPGWVAVGSVDSDGGVWFSEDGLDWIQVNDDDLLAGDRIEATLYDVAAWNDGLIAVGLVGLWDGNGIQASRGAVWVSEDGIEWQELDEASFADARVFEGVSIDPSTDTALVFGTPGGIWSSVDGVTWDASRSDSMRGPPPSSGVAWDGERAIAGGPDMALSLWSTDDSGRNWTRIDSDDPAFEGYAPGVDDVTLFEDRVVAVGHAGEYLADVGAIWIGTWNE
jgi:hypothetical protein